MRIKIKFLNEKAKLPDYSHPGDAAMNLYAAENIEIQPGEFCKVPTGIAAEIPEGYAGLIWDRSSMAVKGIKRMGGVIDSGYRGEIGIVLLNTTKTPYEVRAGDKIAQIIIQKVETPEIVEASELDDISRRGEGGFGSTGR